VTITTIDQLAARIGIERETLALAIQTIPGGVAEYVRRYIIEHYGQMTCVGPGKDGKGVERAGECWERVTGRQLNVR
jgi:hypothetical protein